MERAPVHPAQGRALPLGIAQSAAAAALAVFVLHVATGIGGSGFEGFAQDWLYNGVIAASAALCLCRGLAVGTDRAAWLLFGLGLSSWFAGELYYTLVLADEAAPPYPSLSDALYLGFYPASYLGLMLLTRSRVRELPLSHWVDGAVAALAMSAFGCAVLLEPVIRSTGGDLAWVLTDLAYPVADVVLLALVFGSLALTGWRPGRSWSLICAALVAVAVADGVFVVQAAAGTYMEGTLLEALWPTSTLLLGVAAWAGPGKTALVKLRGWRTVLVPSTLALAALGLLLFGEFHPLNAAAGTLAAGTLLAAIVRMGVTFGENMRMLDASQRDALTDALTGLGNRRRLMEDLEDGLATASSGRCLMLVLLDLDGFKRYNDTFGHPAGDSLLARLGQNLARAAKDQGRAYRLGGDEFCALVAADASDLEATSARIAASLSDVGRGFSVTASYGAVLIPDEAPTAERALQLADQRLYGHKSTRQRTAAAQQTRDALLQALQERQPDLREHLDGVAGLAREVARGLELSADDIDVVVRAAELHDVGKVAVPDSILSKPAALDEVEWGFVRQHTIVGERILSAAPALVPVARLVRSSHERYDGGGYPDGLVGEAIPLGARIVSVCDAYHAMTSERPYGCAMPHDGALAELRACAGAQFDPAVVETFCSAAAHRSSAPSRPTSAVPGALPAATTDRTEAS